MDRDWLWAERARQVREWRASGQTAAEWCRGRDVAPRTLYGWASRVDAVTACMPRDGDGWIALPAPGPAGPSVTLAAGPVTAVLSGPVDPAVAAAVASALAGAAL